MRIEITRAQLLRTTLLAAITASPALIAPAFAQAAQERALPSAADSQDVIVITGTLIGRPDIETVSPVTVVDQENLEVRGINTVQDAIQQLASNNGPALVNSFTANGAFAAGASGVSLRGLSVNSTLVLFDGLRAAYYPLSDDGSRNFVDLNTIPDDIVERVEVLRDGASSIYGADAIAGVVNIITKKEFQGLSARIEGGTSQEGDANQSRISLTAGVGDLGADGINAYVSMFNYTNDLLENYQRPFPFNTSDHSTFCYQDQCGANGVINQIPAAGPFALSSAANFMVRPFDATNTTAAPGSRFQMLNPDCGPGIPATVPPAQQGAVAPSTVCQYDSLMLYGIIQPNVARFGVSGRVTAQLGDFAEVYGQVNFLQSTVDYTGFPAAVVGTAPPGIFFRQFSTAAAGGARDPGSFPLALPVFVCPQRVNCNATNGTLNPNNPFAASGQVARLVGRDMNSVTYDETRNRAYRGAFGIEGVLDNNWTWNVGLTAMHLDFRQINEGYVYIQHLLDVVADGTYNFINPSETPQSVLDYLTPVNISNFSSDQVQLQGYVVAPLMTLPGGSLDLAVGASARYEAVDAPSANSDINGPTERYFTINAFGTQGARRVYSGFFELNAPVLEQVEVNLSGRFDEYSTGQDAFSPKIGVVFTPLDVLTVRGAYSEGFRIPAISEANALPTTGFVSNNATLFNDTYLAQYGCSVETFNVCPAYIRQGSFGQTSLASPDLEPEDSKSITVGFVVEPLRDVSFSLDYYDIEKTGAITTPSNAPAIEAYYTGQPTPAGYTVIADAPDPNFPNATPRIAFVQALRVNADTIRTSGFDFQAVVERDLFAGVHLSSSLELSYINLLETEFPDGRVERYDGTLGNFTLTSGSGTPKVHGSWVNTFTYGDYDVSAAINLFGGYDLSAMDQGTGYKDCGLSDGSTPCRVADYYTFDLTGRARLADNLTVYGTIQNVFDELPPYDPVTYGANYYNAVQGGAGILGRYFKFGIKADY